jgi:hypothetical protein
MSVCGVQLPCFPLEIASQLAVNKHAACTYLTKHLMPRAQIYFSAIRQ